MKDISLSGTNRAQVALPSFWKFILAIAACEATGIISGALSRFGVSTWFTLLEKPWWNPPSYVFGPMWTVLYFLMGISVALIWVRDSPKLRKAKAMFVFGIQLGLNFCWSIFFFRIQSPALAFVDIVLLVVMIIFTIFLFAPISRKASWLLVPYVAWVCFAAMLNFSIWQLNQ